MDLALENDNPLNPWIDVRDEMGNLLYRYKVLHSIDKNEKVNDYDEYDYRCRINPDDKEETCFRVKEKRIITYNPALARKQRAEIDREIDKLKDIISYREAVREELGDKAKYIQFETKDKEGEKVRIAASLNEDKIDEDRRCAGYNMLVTSEIKADPKEIYAVYHNLWRIEESFRILKTYLEARPVFLHDKYAIKGHFLICYVALTLLRLLELKTFRDEIPAAQLVEFMRQYKITKNYDQSYINNATYSKTYEQIKEKLGLSKLGNVYLSQKDVDLLLETELG